MGFALVSSTAGGKSGGSSVLTPEGRLLLERYTAFNAEVQSAAAQAFAKYFK